jgi:hypothetical protein
MSRDVRATKAMSARGWRIDKPGDLGAPESPVVGALASSSSITAAISSVRLQRLVLLLTALSIAIASWAAV